MESIDLPTVETERTKSDRIHCWIDGGADSRSLEWQGCGDSMNLCQLMGVFRAWVEAYDDQYAGP